MADSLHTSVFEPLFSLHPACASPSAPPEWQSPSPSSPPASAAAHSQDRRARTSTALSPDSSGNPPPAGPGCRSDTCKQTCHPTNCASNHHSLPAPPPQSASIPLNRSLSESNVDKHDSAVDDGSVACKLLSSIAKNLSSPSLMSCCKESVRETPYQARTRLRMMKLEHCAEELGSESCDSSSAYSDDWERSNFEAGYSMNPPAKSPMIDRSLSLPSLHEKDQMATFDTNMVSVRSAPNLGCCSLVSRPRERSFPPPLSHTLPNSGSSESFTFALRACRENGRFLLKEVKVPCRQYFQASRKDGRLMLQLCTSDEDIKAETSPTFGQESDAIDAEAGIGNSACRPCNDEIGSCTSLCDAEGEKLPDADKNVAEKQEIVSMPILQRTVVSDGLVMVYDGKRNVRSSDESLSLQTFSTGNKCMVDDDVACSHSLCPTINHVDVFGPKCSSSPTSSPLNSSGCRRARCTTVCSGHICPTSKLSPVSRLPQDEKNPTYESKSNRRGVDTAYGANRICLELAAGKILPGAGLCGDRSVSPTVIFTSVGSNSFMEDLTKLVSSLRLEGAKWCQKRSEQGEPDRSCGVVAKSCCSDNDIPTDNGIKDINAGCTDDARGFPFLDLGPKRFSEQSNAFEVESTKSNDGGGFAVTSKAMLHLDVKLPVQLNRLHSLHCKELSDRSNNLVYMGFPRVAIRS